MRVIFHDAVWEDYLYWQVNDPKILARINLLIKGVRRTPFKGIGKPEPLRGKLTGWWSRRIDQEQRLVYRAADEGLLIAHCRYHYS